MTRLLVSVRDAAEAREALDAGADLIDFKEPRDGALAPVSAPALCDGLRTIAGRVPTSAALGELSAIEPEDLRELPTELTFAKLGLAGCASLPRWREMWREAIGALPAGVAAVAVAYADFPEVDAPAAAAVLDSAVNLGCRALLVDTCRKDGRSLIDHWSLTQLAALIADVRRAGLLSVLGGSLDRAAIERLLPLEPDYIAVRGAVTNGRRAGRLEPTRVRQLSELVRRDMASQL